MRRFSWIVLPLVLVLTPLGFAQRVEIEGRYWITSATNRARLKSTVLNQEIDFQRDLGVNDINIPDLRFRFASRGRHRLEFGYTHLDWNGDQQVNRTVEFNNRLYTVGTRVVTDLTLDYVKLGWTWYALDVAEGRFRLGPTIEGHGMWYEASLAAPVLALRAADRRSVGYPSAGLAMEAAPHRRAILFAQATGITLGSYGYFTGGEAGARVSPVAHIGLTAGYRMFRVNPKFEPDYVRLSVSGPFVGASLRW